MAQLLASVTGYRKDTVTGGNAAILNYVFVGHGHLFWSLSFERDDATKKLPILSTFPHTPAES